ncbi:hypothetical protein BGZ80_011525, partial [Entomortierella chlamydospora]
MSVFVDRLVQGDLSIQKVTKSFQELTSIDFGTLPTHWTQTNQISASKFAKYGMTWSFTRTLFGLIHADAHEIEIQVDVCKSLGSLTPLKELALGVDDDNDPLLNNWVEGTLVNVQVMTSAEGIKRLLRYRMDVASKSDADMDDEIRIGPCIQSALIKNAKYIRVIQAETCRVLAPFLKDDAMSLRNIHMLQLQFSVQPTLRMRTEDPSYVDAIRDIKKQEAKNLLPVKVMDWLQERDVFLWRHEIALRSLAPDQSKLQLIRETQLNSLYQVVVSVELQFADVVSSSSSIMRYLASIYKHRNFPRLKGLLDSSFFTDLQPVWDNIETRHARLNFALGESQQFRPATFIRQYMQLLLCVVDARNTRFNIDSNA